MHAKILQLSRLIYNYITHTVLSGEDGQTQ